MNQDSIDSLHIWVAKTILTASMNICQDKIGVGRIEFTTFKLSHFLSAANNKQAR